MKCLSKLPGEVDQLVMMLYPMSLTIQEHYLPAEETACDQHKSFVITQSKIPSLNTDSPPPLNGSILLTPNNMTVSFSKLRLTMTNMPTHCLTLRLVSMSPSKFQTPNFRMSMVLSLLSVLVIRISFECSLDESLSETIISSARRLLSQSKLWFFQLLFHIKKR